MKALVWIPLLLVSFQLPAQESSQAYGHCDLIKVWKAMPERNAIARTLSEMEERYREDRAAMLEEYATIRAVDPEKWRTWSDEKRDSAYSSWQRMEVRIAAYREKMERALIEKETSLMKPVRERIRTAIRAIARKNGLAYVFDSSSREVLHAGGGRDITRAVIARLTHMNRKKARPYDP